MQFVIMSFIKTIASHVKHYEIDESLVALLQKQMMDPGKLISAPKDYFYVTQLVNPAQTYWDKTTGGIPKPPELRRKLAKGNRLQGIVSIWFQKLPDFMVESSKLDGAIVGLRGVRGELDYRIGESIIELKTKDKLPLTPDEIFTKFPQDLEQLMIYSTLHPLNPKINYLVFMTNKKPYKFATFRVTIKDFGQIRGLIEERINSIKKAIAEKNPAELGKCRYYGHGCQYEKEHCNCKDIPPLRNQTFDTAIEIKFDKEFNEKLETAKEKSGEKEIDWFSLWEVLNPRLHYLDRIIGKVQEYTDQGFDKDAFDACIWSAIKKLNMDLNLIERQEIYSNKKEPRIKTAFRWLKIPHSGKTEYQTLPFIYKVSRTSTKSQTMIPNEFHLAQLGVLCAAHGVSRGLIIVIYPFLDKLVRVFQIDFKDMKIMQKLIEKRLDDCEQAETEQKPLLLDPCPDFINKNKKCPLTRICHSEKGAGCIHGLYYPEANPKK